MKRILPFFLAILLFLSGCGLSDNADTAVVAKYQAEFLDLFDTLTVISGYSDSEENFKSLAQEVCSKLEEYHKLYDIYNTYEGINNLKTVNDNAGIMPVEVDSRIITMLKFAEELYVLTDGAVNAAFGAVLSIWHTFREAGINEPGNAALPPKIMLEEASKHTDINDLIIDEEASTVFLKDPYMSIDAGAIAKGYAVEQTAAYFKEQGIQSLLINVGGNIRAIGSKPLSDAKGDTGWVIGLQNPDKDSGQQRLLTLGISDMSVVSGGSYERYYTVDDVSYGHIIDPETLMPSDRYLSVTVIARDSGLCDALSTALFIMTPEDGRALLGSLDGASALWVMPDGAIEYTECFNQYIISSS